MHADQPTPTPKPVALVGNKISKGQGGEREKGSAPRVFPLESLTELLEIRLETRRVALELGFSLYQACLVMTVISELGRNVLQYAGSGCIRLLAVNQGVHSSYLLVDVEDEGAGVGNKEWATLPGTSTSGGLGLGLSGAKKVAGEFELRSSAGTGTRILLTFRPDQ